MSEYVTVQEAAEILGRSGGSVTRYIVTGVLPAERDRSKRGSPYRIKRSDAEQMKDYTPSASPFACAVYGCTKRVGQHGLCWHHHNERVKARIEADPKRLRCAWPEGCSNAEELVGFCKGHYSQIRYNADLEHLLPEEHRSERCLVPHCDSPQYANGVCRNHDTRSRPDHLGSMSEVLRRDIEVEPLTDELGEQIRLWRILRGDTLETVSQRMGITRERVRQIEAKLGERLKERPHSAIAGSEVRYLQTIEFPIDRLVFSGEKEFV